MEETFGTIFRLARERKGFTVHVLAQISDFSESHLHDFEQNRRLPLPEEVEHLIGVLQANPDLAHSLRVAAGISNLISSTTPVIQVLSEDAGGLHPWAQAIFSAELINEGPRNTVLGYFSSRVRPIELTLKQYQWDGVSDADLGEIRSLLVKRRESWLRTLELFQCRDIYPKVWIEKYCTERRWFGKILDTEDVINHLLAVEAELSNCKNYEIGLMTGEELYFNFLIQRPYVLIEGGYEVEKKASHRFAGGLKISIPDVVRSFEQEFERMWSQIAESDRNKEEVIKWLREQRRLLE